MSKQLHFKHGIVRVNDNTIPIDIDTPDASDFACVIEVNRGERYNAPHFVFFSEKKPNEFSHDDTERIYAACTVAYPDFSQIIEDEVICVPNKIGVFVDHHGNPKTEADFMQAPWIGIFLMDPQCKGKNLPCNYSIDYNDEDTRLSLQERIMGYRYG